jgi:transketolase
VAAGAALAKKLNHDSCFVYVLTGDGELQEGQIWEALMFCAARKIDNIIITVDYNGRQIDGDVNDVMSLGDLTEKFKSFGCLVNHIDNGNNLEQVLIGLNKAKSLCGKGKPVINIMKTEMGHGVDFMMGSHKWHGVAPNDEQLQKALAQNETTLGDF